MPATRLSQNDWDTLEASINVVFGKTVITVKPMSVYQVQEFTESINGVLRAMDAAGINYTNLDAHLPAVFEILMDHAPEVIEVATGLHRDDIKRLPVAKGFELLRAFIEVNVGGVMAVGENINSIAAMLQRLDMATFAEVVK